MDRRGNEGHKDLPQLRRVVEVAGDRWEGQEAAAVLRWARRDDADAVEAHGAIVVEVRRGRIIFAAVA